jgi:hypothetical protein
VVHWGVAGTTAAEVRIGHLWPCYTKGLEILVMHNQDEEGEIENDGSYHVGVTKCKVAGEWIRSADLRITRLKG